MRERELARCVCCVCCVCVCGWWLAMSTVFFEHDVNGYLDDGLDDS